MTTLADAVSCIWDQRPAIWQLLHWWCCAQTTNLNVLPAHLLKVLHYAGWLTINWHLGQTCNQGEVEDKQDEAIQSKNNRKLAWHQSLAINDPLLQAAFGL
jgi:sugar/nucleoside kinase (ribokinase family)